MTIAERLAEIQGRIQNAREKSLYGQEVTLLAVSKGHDGAAIETALTAGHRVFAENRVQEANGKFPALREKYPGLSLHLIGPLQTNKVKEAVALFDVIHSVDRASLAEKLAVEMEKQNRRLPCFIQVNTGEETQKAGVLPKDLPGLLRLCRDQKLNVIGLMCIPPVNETPSVHFAFLKKLADEHNLPQLSMGMSGDFETAVRFGATHVRVGSAIFGERDYSGATSPL